MASDKSLAAEIEAATERERTRLIAWLAEHQVSTGTTIDREMTADALMADFIAPRLAEIAALQSRAFEDRARSPRVDTQVWTAATSLDAVQAAQPEWLWYEHDHGRVSFGRWPRVAGSAPYVRADIALPLQPEGERSDA